MIFRPPSLLPPRSFPPLATSMDARAAVAFTSEQNAVRYLPAVDTVIAVKEIFDWVDLIWVSPAGMKVCWKRIRASSPRAAARPFGLRGLTPASASNRGPPCDRYLDVAQQP